MLSAGLCGSRIFCSQDSHPDVRHSGIATRVQVLRLLSDFFWGDGCLLMNCQLADSAQLAFEHAIGTRQEGLSRWSGELIGQ